MGVTTHDIEILTSDALTFAPKTSPRCGRSVLTAADDESNDDDEHFPSIVVVVAVVLMKRASRSPLKVHGATTTTTTTTTKMTTNATALASIIFFDGDQVDEARMNRFIRGGFDFGFILMIRAAG